METLLVEREAGVVTVTLQRPEKKNAVSGAMWRELRDTIDEIARNADDRVLIVTGAGDGFCAGQDLRDEENAREFANVGGVLRSMRRIGGIALALHNLAKPTIAAVNGVAAGAGANLALGCDLILAGESARFSQIFVQRALSIDFGGSWLLPRLVGLHKAKELALFGDMVSAAEAREIGFVNRVVPDAELMPVAREWAQRLASSPPLALSAIKMALNAGVDASMEHALEHEAVAQAMMYTSLDAREAMTAFIEKRAPQFRGE